MNEERSCNVVIGSGIDVIDTGRVQRELARGAWTPTDGVFTQSEIAFCNHGRSSALLFTICFVSKEATLKALGLEVDNLSRFRDVEVHPGPGCNYTLTLHGYARSVAEHLGVRHVSLAVTTTPKLSGAVVVLES